MTINQILLQKGEPSNTGVLWIKPVGSGVALYVFNNGHWQLLKIMNDGGTTSTDDDTIEDVSNLNEVVKDEVTKQVEEMEKGEVSSSESSDQGEYPDINVIKAGSTTL